MISTNTLIFKQMYNFIPLSKYLLVNTQSLALSISRRDFASRNPEKPRPISKYAAIIFYIGI